MNADKGSLQFGFCKDGTIALEVDLQDRVYRIPISVDEAMVLAGSLNDIICLSIKNGHLTYPGEVRH